MPFVANNGKASTAKETKEHKHKHTHTLLKPKTKAENRMEN